MASLRWRGRTRPELRRRGPGPSPLSKPTRSGLATSVCPSSIRVANGRMARGRPRTVATETRNETVDWSRRGLEAAGFLGFVPFADLDQAQVPRASGVYLVARPGFDVPRFLPSSPAGWFKGRDPSVPMPVLRANWVAAASVLYIGKAAGGTTGQRGLRRRLGEFRRHGHGKPTGHWGGRYIWQLEDSDLLLVCWQATSDEDPEQVEAELLARFVTDHGALPFANLKRGHVT